MTKEQIISTVTQKTESILKEGSAHFLVEVRIKPTNNIKVYIDGDSGVGIDDLVKYNRNLYKLLEDAALFPDGDFSLEVSSPGLDEPLKLHRQYLKNIGRDVEIIMLDGSSLSGKLIAANDVEIEAEEIKGKGKKAEAIKHTILFNNIKTTKVQIKF